MLTRLRKDLTAALKARDQIAVAALRSALSAIENAEAVPADHPMANGTGSEHFAAAASGLGAAEAERRDLTDGEQRSIIGNEIRERSVAAQEYEQLGRTDIAERLRAEGDVLRRYVGPAR